MSQSVRPVVATSVGQLDEVRAVLLGSVPSSGGRPGCAVVMTMGALHEGHLQLMRVARERVGPEGVVIATVFVNPMQFGAGEDFDRYPRTLDADVAACATAGVDVVFAPSVSEMYGAGGPGLAAAAVTVDAGPLGDVLEGAVRPGHFRGVLTVVAKLLHLVRPDVAVFGEKDYQQLTLIRLMVRDLDFGVEVVGVPTVREADGLAMSSRNRYLSPDERQAAAAIPRAGEAAVRAADDGWPPAEVEDAVRAVLADQPGLEPDYVVVRDLDLGDPPASGPARLLLAVRAGGTRLIDNVALTMRSGSP